MTVCFQVDDLRKLEEVLVYPGDEIRIGAEFCENKILSLNDLKKFLPRIVNSGKAVSVVYPRLSNLKMGEVLEGLDFLNCFAQENKKNIEICANDLGMIHWIRKKNLMNLKINFGRQLISVPKRARPPMPKIMGKENMLSKFADRQLFNKTSLNYKLTLQFIKKLGISGIEVDYIPDTFPELMFFLKKGLQLNIHLGNIFVAFTRKCHTARHFHQEYHACGHFCREKKFSIFHEVLGELYLDGNVVLDYIPIKENDLLIFKNKKGVHFIVDYQWLNVLHHMPNQGQINELIKGIFK